MATAINSSALSVRLVANILALAVCFATSSANAERISYSLKGTRTIMSAPAPTTPLSMSIRDRLGQPSSLFVLADLESDSGDRMINYQIGNPASFEAVIREENAGDFGLNWQAFQDGISGFRKTVDVRLGSSVIYAASATATTFTPIPDSNNLFLLTAPTDFDMDEIRVKVDYYFYHPVFSTLRAAKVSFELDGTGDPATKVVPELSTMLLGLIGAGSLAFRRRCGHRRRQ